MLWVLQLGILNFRDDIPLPVKNIYFYLRFAITFVVASSGLSPGEATMKVNETLMKISVFSRRAMLSAKQNIRPVNVQASFQGRLRDVGFRRKTYVRSTSKLRFKDVCETSDSNVSGTSHKVVPKTFILDQMKTS